MKAFIVSQALLNVTNDTLIMGVFTSFDKAAEAVAENGEISWEYIYGYDALMEHSEDEYKKHIVDTLRKDGCISDEEYAYSIDLIELDTWFD